MSIDLARTPLIPPPPGVTPNFVNPESRADSFVIGTAICTSFLLPIVLMRLYLRLWINRSFAVDDGQLSSVAFWFLLIHNSCLYSRNGTQYHGALAVRTV